MSKGQQVFPAGPCCCLAAIALRLPCLYGRQGMELEDDQRAALRAGSRQVRRAAALLRSVNPESFKAAEYAKRVCDQAWNGRACEPATEDVANAFAGLLRYAPTVGPGAQETLQNALERLIDRMGLGREVQQALQTPQEKKQGKSR